MRLFLLGIKHSGKTTFGKLLAKKYGITGSDSDDLVLKEIAPESIREYYAEHGKESFQEIEYRAIDNFLEENKEQDFVLSLGGGVSDSPETLDLLKGKGILIYLKRSEGEMLSVILKHGVPAFLDAKNIENSFHKIYQERDSIYSAAADLVIDMGPYRDREETLLFLDEKIREYLDAR